MKEAPFDSPMQLPFLISREAFRASLLPLLLNFVITALVIFYLVNTSNWHTQVDYADLGVELFSAISYVILYWVTFLTNLGGVLRLSFASSLLLIQIGRIMDSLDEVADYQLPHASMIGDSVTMLGEVFLAFTAFRWVIRTNKSALTDPLTGLYNRRYHLGQLARLVALGHNTGTPFAVVAIDLDNFKLVNDRFGHAVGDQVIKHAADVIRRHSRDVDTISRVGGEEFELLIPNCDRNQARSIAERLRGALEKSPPAPLTGLSASFGVAVFGNAMEGEEVRDLADAALYQSKRQGRNRVTLAWAMSEGTDADGNPTGAEGPAENVTELPIKTKA